MQVDREGNAVTGVVHNLGSKPAEVVAALVDDRGKLIESKSLGSLDWPSP